VRVGVFGGAFNPPHVGHLVCAQEAHHALGLDVVVFVPVGDPPHRVLEDDPGREARLTMCEYAISADGRFRLSRAEVDREGKSYTADTLRELRERSPDDELVLILGADAAIGVAEREGIDREQVVEGVKAVPGAVDKLAFFDMPRLDVSSSLVRRRAAAGRPIRYLVPDKVAGYIGAQSLYGASAPVGAGR